ncbi:MAG: hypothetical protein CMH13_01485 [Martelella sp.]|nr:hypothetical protein [Martelella sp.]
MPKFLRGDPVRKRAGSSWHGIIVGEYSTDLTSEGYCVESLFEKGSVQIYPAAALELITTAKPPTRQEFIDRFVKKMVEVAGERFTDGHSIADYAKEIAPTFFDDPSQRVEGPESCALADIDCWER